MAGDVRKHLFQGIAPVSGDEARGRLAVHDLALQMDTKVAAYSVPSGMITLCCSLSQKMSKGPSETNKNVQRER